MPPISETGDRSRTDISDLSCRNGNVRFATGPASKKRLEISLRKTVTVGKKNGALLHLPASDSYKRSSLHLPCTRDCSCQASALSFQQSQKAEAGVGIKTPHQNIRAVPQFLSPERHTLLTTELGVVIDML
ncbi:hypothetical protein OPV22_001294 [Ensete ventricosum]|uniref:Uncharacterized protein n=1 Tax=Ensete ventricosum TaxID=4639 RepID=A0AAV8QDD9_ENSVE|nr:hypothetical protein OPV22_001294 [Ensete ventricosum]